MITIILVAIVAGLLGIIIGKSFAKNKQVVEQPQFPIVDVQKIESDWKEKMDLLKSNCLLEKEKALLEKEEDFKSREKEMRADSVKKSKSVMLGKMWEQIVPHYRPKDFTFTPSDARFLGSPIDFIVFEGSAETDIQEVIFLEIKTAKSRLNHQL